MAAEERTPFPGTNGPYLRRTIYYADGGRDIVVHAGDRLLIQRFDAHGELTSKTVETYDLDGTVTTTTRYPNGQGATYIDVPENVDKIPRDDVPAGGGHPLDKRPPKDRPVIRDRVNPGVEPPAPEAPRLAVDPRDLVSDPKFVRGPRFGVVRPIENKSVRERDPRPPR